eukprot:8273583-Pyramimonas_sp.AAC.1
MGDIIHMYSDNIFGRDWPGVYQRLSEEPLIGEDASRDMMLFALEEPRLPRSDTTDRPLLPVLPPPLPPSRLFLHPLLASLLYLR